MRHDLESVQAPSEEAMTGIAALFADCGVPVRIGG
jgi:hypothetical protein